ncbi:MAG: nitroreductase family protein [Phycisphaerales bacterium]|nr:nitroreductase family protein [Phycisphaerales bacterium]
MSIISALNWRYATKRMNGEKIPNDKMDSILDAISKAPSSFGLQPYSILVIENKELLSKIKPIAMMQPQITEASALLVFAAWDKLSEKQVDTFMQEIADTRKVTVDSLKELKGHITPLLKKSDSDNFMWHARQAYIALGVALVAAAEEGIDSTPMEGFDNAQLDELLQLKQKGLRSVVLMALGHRDAANDYLVKLKKVRRVKEKLFIKMQ